MKTGFRPLMAALCRSGWRTAADKTTAALALMALMAGSLVNAADWQAAATYGKGDSVTYLGQTYQARWWTRGETPGTEWGAWQVHGHAVPAQLKTIRGGTFTMGATITSGFNYPNEYPLHQVTLGHYQIGRTEVTFAEFDRYTSATGRPPASSLDLGGFELGRHHLPVVNVSWFDVIRYINWLNQQQGWPVSYNEHTGDLLDAAGQPTRDIRKVFGYRLPTEAEWEYAARERDRDLINAWGNGLPLNGNQPLANIADRSFMLHFGELAQGFNPWPGVDDGHARLAPVGSYPANALGLYDMSGNVWEWISDRERVYTSDPQVNPLGDNAVLICACCVAPAGIIRPICI
ncbi:SUMF1/EgtB/PvdO family nonheme iron enzyme [Chitinibacter sp. FCG-7]|uniref:SUMF1/EgtB/PvdO family nonheme iron enzyme n=1 Tax=Chitinibacter mangrovi TaxID=3153927 RepID=A0AAU7FBL6_9NEIS